MTESDIAEMFIRAAETEAKLPAVQGFRESWGGYSLPWVHEKADINMRRREMGDQLLDADDPLSEWGKGVTKALTEWERRAMTAQIVNWEACINITREFVSDPKRRRALWAWAMAQAGTLRQKSFTRWCRKVERVHEETGNRRKNAAIDEILQAFAGKDGLRGENTQSTVLPFGPEISHVPDTVPGVYEAKPNPTWRDDPAFAPFDIQDARKRKAARREQYAKRKAEAA